MQPISTSKNDSSEIRTIESQKSRISAKQIDLFGKIKLEKMKNFGSSGNASKMFEQPVAVNTIYQESISPFQDSQQRANSERWKFGNRRLTVQLDKIDQSSSSTILIKSPIKMNNKSGLNVGNISPDKQSIISFEHQSTRKSQKEQMLQKPSFNYPRMQLYSPQPRRQMIQNRALKQMNLPGTFNQLLQSPGGPSARQNSINKRQIMFQKQRPGRLDLQAVGRGGKQSMMSFGQQLPSPLLSRQYSPKSACLIPMSPMTIDSRAKHSKVVQKLIQESDTLKQKTKREKFRKKNTILKNAGAFIKGNTKNRSTQFGQKQNVESTENKDEEDVELEVFKQFLEANQQEPSCGVFSPDTVWKSFWDFLMFVWIGLGNRSDGITTLDYFMDVCFGIDILLNFNTGFYKNGVLILNRKLIFLAYFKSWFMLDLVSTIPYSNIVEYFMTAQESMDSYQNSSASQLLRLIRVVRFLRFLKLLRVLKLSSLKQKYEDLIYNDNIGVLSGIVKILVLILFSTHTFACLFWLVGYQSSSSRDKSWILEKGLLDDEITSQYINSMYWAFTTLVSLGYGDISATNTDERLISMLSMILFSWVYAFTLNQISKIVSQYNTAAVQFKENMFYVQKWMKQHNLNKDLSLQIRRFLEYQWDLREQQKIEEEDVMKLLNQDLREKLILYTNAKQLRNLSFSNQFTVDFISDLSFKMQPQTFGVGENIILEQEDGDRIYFITSGKVCVLHRKTHTYLDDLSVDDYFGEISFFTEQPRTTSVKARDFTSVIYLDRTSYLYSAEASMSNAMGVYYKMQNALKENDYSYMNIRCFICRQADHIAIYCEQFKLQRGNLHKIFNKLYMNQEKVKKAQSNNNSQSRQNTNALNTMEQVEMRDVALLIDRDENNDIMQVNTLNTQMRSSIASQDMIKHLYQEAGYDLQKDSFGTELTSLNGDQNQSEDNNSQCDEETKRNMSTINSNRKRIPNLPSFYRVVNLENNKSIKKSQFDNVKPGLLQKNKNYTTSSNESNDSFSDSKRQEEISKSPPKLTSDTGLILQQIELNRSQKLPSPQTLPDLILDDSDQDEVIEDFGHVETIIEAEENEEETPGNKHFRFRNTLRKYLLSKQSEADGSFDSSNQSSPQPFETGKKNSRKISSSFLGSLKLDIKKARVISSSKNVIQPKLHKSPDKQVNEKDRIQSDIHQTLDEFILEGQTSDPANQQPATDIFQFNEDSFRAQSLDLPQLIQLQSQLLQKQTSRGSGGGYSKQKTNLLYREQLQLIQEQDDEFDPIQEESSSISGTTTFVNRLSTLEKKQQNTPETPIDSQDQEQEKTYDGEEEGSQSLHNMKNRGKTITDSLSFKTSIERVQYFNLLEQEIAEELQHVFDSEDGDVNVYNAGDRSQNDDSSSQNKDEFEFEKYLELMEQKNQNNNVVKNIEEMFGNSRLDQRMQHLQIRVDSLEAHDFTSLNLLTHNQYHSQQNSNQQSHDNSYFDFQVEQPSINTDLENKLVKEFEKHVLGMEFTESQINSSSQDQNIESSFVNSGNNSLDVTQNDQSQNQTFLDVSNQSSSLQEDQNQSQQSIVSNDINS
eukprot:403333513